MSLTKVTNSMIAGAAINVLDKGAVSGGSAATNTAAFLAAITDAVAAKGSVVVPDGTYALTAGTNFLLGRDVALIGIGTPILNFSAGVGVGFKLDAGGSGANYRGIRIENFIIVGGVNITDGFYSCGLVGGVFKNIEVRECSSVGFNLKFSITCTYENCRVSNDSLAMTTRPATYFQLGNDGTYGNRCQDNTFISCDASGTGAAAVDTSTGWHLMDSSVNTWIGGTSESMGTGILIDAISVGVVSNRLNTLINMDIEDCTTYGLIDYGTNNTYIGMDFASSIDMFGDGATFSGGSIGSITLEATSSNTSFHGVGLDSGTGITAVVGATYSRYGCFTTDATGSWVAALADRGIGYLSASAAGIGYAVGVGGNVNQGTSRTTGVTINNICGAITLFAAAGSATWQSFTVTNSTVVATDTIIINQQAGADLYIVQITNVSAGSFRVSFATTGGVTIETPTFSFAVIKSVFA